MVAKARSQYRCSECHHITAKWVGRCAECQQWGTVVESGTETGITRSLQPVAPSSARAARPIRQVEADDTAHRPSGIGEFDRAQDQRQHGGR